MESWNGVLIGYMVTWREVDGVKEGSACVRGPSRTELVVEGLREGTRYAVTARAYSVVGVGPPAPLVYVTTGDDGGK